MLAIPAAIIAIALTWGYIYNKEHPQEVITPDKEEVQKDSKASIEDGYSAKEDIYSSKDAKDVILMFPYHDFMDRPEFPILIPIPPPPICNPPCVTNVNPRGWNE